MNISSGNLFTDDERGGSKELAFKYAVFRINKDPKILPNTTLTYDTKFVSKEDSFHASKYGELRYGNFMFARISQRPLSLRKLESLISLMIQN